MMSILLDGKSLSKEIENELKQRVENIIKKTGNTPVLATILVGNDLSSEIYVKMKGNACGRVGMKSLKVHLVLKLQIFSFRRKRLST